MTKDFFGKIGGYGVLIFLSFFCFIGTASADTVAIPSDINLSVGGYNLVIRGSANSSAEIIEVNNNNIVITLLTSPANGLPTNDHITIEAVNRNQLTLGTTGTVAATTQTCNGTISIVTVEGSGTATITPTATICSTPGGGGGGSGNPTYCGDASCNNGETCVSCAQDCGACAPSCGDNICNGTETCSTCSQDCGVCTVTCGDNICNGTETCSTCSQDCGACAPFCGDTMCNGTETCNSCSQDCGACPPPTPVCGDNICNGTETCNSCSQDCGVCSPLTPFCGDSFCNGTETCSTCSQDCGVCAPTYFCGDALCNNGETCSTCSQDCGSCPGVPGTGPGTGTGTGGTPGGGGGGISAYCGDNTCDSTESCSSCEQDCGECSSMAKDIGEKISGIVPGLSNAVQNITEGIKSGVEGTFSKAAEAIKAVAPENIQQAAEATKEVIGSGTGQAVSETVVGVSTAVAVAQGVSGILPPLSTASQLALTFTRFFGLLAELLGIRKRSRKWGVVYDAYTKRPLDPAYVTIYDAQGKEMESKITDMDGRFGFLVGAGVYKMSSNKTNYSFPSAKVAGSSDELYDNVYHGELVDVKNADIINMNIPMDPVGIDWNEQIKKEIMKFNPKKEIWLKNSTNTLFWIGFVISPLMYWAMPNKLNLGLVITYLVLAGLRTVGFRSRNYGRIYDKATGKPLSFARVKVFLKIPGLPDQRLVNTVADITGKYYILVVGKGNYELEISGETLDGRKIQTRVPVEVKERIINFDIAV